MKESKKSVSGSSRRSGLSDYEDEGMDLAAKFLRLRVTRPGALSKEDVRKAIDALPPTATLQVTVADFWLGLAKKEAHDRRRVQPPINPFKRDGKFFFAGKASIEEWELAWRMIEGSRALAVSRVRKVRQIADRMRYQFNWFVQGGRVVGLTEQPPSAALLEALTRPEQLSVQGLTLVQALRMPWKDPTEQMFWIERLQHGNRAEEAELEYLAMKATADENPA